MTKEPGMYNGVNIVSSINGVGKMDCHMQKTETETLFYNAHTNEVKVD